MLATMTPSHHDITQRERSHHDTHLDSPDALSNQANLEDRLCPGCKKSAVSEQGGLVVAFGQSFFHVDCFKCAKCSNQVTADTNLLLLTDGSPICSNCSFSCNVCHTLILDEAIMAGDDSYHAHCFKCKVCNNRINELVFAKTSQGIYCMPCHNERMIRIRKHTQKKAERDRAAGGSGSSKSRDREARNYHQDTRPSAGHEDHSRPGSSKTNTSQSADGQLRNSRSTENTNGTRIKPTQYVGDAFEPKRASDTQTNRSQGLHPPSPSSSYNQQNAQASFISAQHHEELKSTVKQNTLPVPSASVQLEPEGRRRSYDDGVRPLDVLLRQHTQSIQRSDTPSDLSKQPSGLTVGTSRREKRRSINPGLTISSLDPKSSPSTGTRRPDSPYAARPSPTGAHNGEHDSSRTSSPYQENFPQDSAPHRSKANTSSLNSINSFHSFGSAGQSGRDQLTLTRSRSPSVTLYDHDQEDQTVVLKPQNVDQDQSPPAYSYVRPLPTPGPQSFPRLPKTMNTEEQIRHQVRRSNEEVAHSESVKRSSSTSTSTLALDRPHSVAGSRSASPAHRADVPHGIESGTDTEAEVEVEIQSPLSEQSPSPLPTSPQRDVKPVLHSNGTSIHADTETDVSAVSPVESDEHGEATEQTSHATFVAPALPPIRFSLNAGDFGDLLNSVGGSASSRKTLDALAKLSRQPTASSPQSESEADSVDSPTTTKKPHTVGAETSNGLKSIAESTVDDAPQAVTTVTELLSEPEHTTDTSPNKDTPSQSEAPVNGSDTLLQPSPTNLQDQDMTIEDLSKSSGTAQITLTAPESSESTILRHESVDTVLQGLHDSLKEAKEHGIDQLKFHREFVEAIIENLESKKAESTDLKEKVDGMKRTSKQYMEGLTVAQTEYDRELKARRDAETEVTRLRVLLSGQAARITALSGDSRRQEVRQQISKELNESLSGLESDLSRLKAERDVTLAEVEELSVSKSSSNHHSEKPSTTLGRSLTKRLENIRVQYQRELIPLTQQREALNREIAELKAVRDVFLEETTVLNARNEELAQLSAVYARRVENMTDTSRKISVEPPRESIEKPSVYAPYSASIAPSLSMSSSSSTYNEDSSDSKYIRVQRSDGEMTTPSKGKFKWPGSRVKEAISSPVSAIDNLRGKAAHIEHNFQQLSVLRFTRCDHCGDKMWGSQLRCTICTTSIHVRCIANVHIPCVQQQNQNIREDQQMSLPPSMFGRDLTEQVRADARDGDRQVPVIVEKCIDAVEHLALDYEGIYRKTGGSSQTKAITQLFEHGDYASFDLRNTDRFNDICSVTSVLKTYFRSLPIPLLTFDLHDQFMSAVSIKDPAMKHRSLIELIEMLPNEHYYTLRMLMLHLNRVRERCERNLMNARNLGVVFGPTLSRSRDPGSEFSDMAGKALFIEWMVENAPQIFSRN